MLFEVKSIANTILQNIKKLIRNNKSSSSIFIRCSIKILYFLRNILNSEFRAIFFMSHFNTNVHQTTNLTFMDRFPDIFSKCRDYFGGKDGLKILSFGCATGEEVLTLRQYFPNANIIGAEINKNSLKKCKKLNVDDKISFIFSSHKELKKHGGYDAIFCMAVLQRTPHHIDVQGITDIKIIYPFEKFEKQIVELDDLLNPNGLLVVHYSQYSFRDTSVATKYVALDNCNQDSYNLPVFDKNSILIKNSPSIYTVFIKKPGNA
jgi:Methylase of chemotaxis methyl-accepting proteins